MVGYKRIRFIPYSGLKFVVIVLKTGSFHDAKKIDSTVYNPREYNRMCESRRF